MRLVSIVGKVVLLGEPVEYSGRRKRDQASSVRMEGWC